MYYTRGLPLTLYFPLLPRSVPDHGRVDPGAKKKKPCMMAGGLMFKACGLYIQSYSQDTVMKQHFCNMVLTSNTPLAVSRLLKSFSWMKEEAFRCCSLSPRETWRLRTNFKLLSRGHEGKSLPSI